MNEHLTDKPHAAKAVEPTVPGQGEAAKPSSVKPRRRTGRWTFILFVILPTLLVAANYIFIASNHYRSELRFAIRGTEASPLDSLGFSALTGSTTKAADAYIVMDYIRSKQVILDIQSQLNIDIRTYFSRANIDPVYKIKPDMPIDKFVYYWNWMIDSGFNSVTGITTFEVTAFNPEDARDIAVAVLKVANNLVNELSTEARNQLIEIAQTEVTRTEERLSGARLQLSQFRNREQSLNPALLAQSEQDLIQGIEKELINLKSRRAALTSSVDTDSPQVRVIDRQIKGIELELQAKRQAIGSGLQGSGKSDSLSTVLIEYEALALEQEFSEKAYTSALSSLESSQAEARKRERYFAIVVEPTLQDASLYPLGWLNTLIFLIAASVLWLLGYFVIQSVRDHSV
jgi:capsular polysaccharide transport system permease protein